MRKLWELAVFFSYCFFCFSSEEESSLLCFWAEWEEGAGVLVQAVLAVVPAGVLEAADSGDSAGAVLAEAALPVDFKGREVYS